MKAKDHSRVRYLLEASTHQIRFISSRICQAISKKNSVEELVQVK